MEDSFVFINDRESMIGTPTQLNTCLQGRSGLIECREHIKFLKKDMVEDHIRCKESLCTNCIDNMFSELESDEEMLEKEIKMYEEQIAKYENNGNNGMSYEEYMVEMEELRREELVLYENMQIIQNERSRLGQKLSSLMIEVSNQKSSESNYWKTFFQTNDTEIQMADAQNVKKLEHYLEEKPTPIISSMFHIWYEKITEQVQYGTINGLKMGRANSKPSWDEVNAAWGLCALLVDIVTKQSNFKFQKYKVFPKGSLSYVEELESGEIFDLFFSASREISKFNQGMKSFLSCVEELCQFVERSSPTGSRVPIEDDKIHGQRITYAPEREREAEWTKALKYMLLNLKYIQRNIAKKTTL